jgi:acetolactate synthase-1/2/3 large subunit
MKNAELMVRTLEQAGVRSVFGVPSGPVLPLIEALRRSSVRFVLTASETSAGFMASATGYLSGIPGVCVSTVGPGATNLATGVGCAWLDRAPVLAITCNVATPWLDRRVQMRIDHQALFQPLTKATVSLRDGRVGPTITKALALASAEPPGPVHLDLPEDVAEAGVIEFVAPRSAPQVSPVSSGALVGQVSKALTKACRPLVVTGLSFTRSRAPRELLEFIERQKVPFVSTLHAKGFLPESHSNWMGVIGRARRTNVRTLVSQADLILALGFDPIEINYEEWAGKIPVMHIDGEATAASTGLNLLWNEACDLDEAIRAISRLPPYSNEWSTAEWEDHRRLLEQFLRPAGYGFAAHNVLDILRDRLPAHGILACDVGAHTHQIATQWRTDHPKTLLATNGWSSMGYGMPAAYAAKLVFPDRPVVGVIGDGGFQMTAGELATARRLELSVPVIVLSDGWLGLMKVKQERRNYPLCGVRLGVPPEPPAHYFGVPCRPARTSDGFHEALDWAFARRGPSVIEAFIDVGPYSATVFD